MEFKNIKKIIKMKSKKIQPNHQNDGMIVLF